MIYGVYVQPVDFASFLVSIVILNLLMYFAFYIIMKVKLISSHYYLSHIISLICHRLKFDKGLIVVPCAVPYAMPVPDVQIACNLYTYTVSYM